jgi:hypothetical protein
MRLRDRAISREAILSAVETFVLVEPYPEDKYLPSYLLLGTEASGAFHILVAVDVPGDNVRVVTAYRPNQDEWLPDLRTRRNRT